MTNIANAAALAQLDGNTDSIDSEDHELYRLMVDLELHTFRARLEFMVTNDRTTKMKKHLTTIGDIYDKIKTIMGSHPPSTGSRRCSVRNELPPGMLSGDTRTSRKLGRGGRPGTPAGTGVGDADRSFVRDDSYNEA